MIIKRILIWMVFIVLTIFAIIGTFVLIGISQERFLLPRGDIISIDTGVFGKKRLKNPFTDRSGEFYYIIKLQDGTEINLNSDAGGTYNNQDIYEVFEDIDKSLVSMGINKTASTANFELLAKDLDKIYSDRIKNVLNNVR